jgi:hypothetical protein
MLQTRLRGFLVVWEAIQALHVAAAAVAEPEDAEVADPTSTALAVSAEALAACTLAGSLKSIDWSRGKLWKISKIRQKRKGSRAA